MATTRDLLEAGMERLRAAALDARLGLETPRLDAELLLANLPDRAGDPECAESLAPWEARVLGGP